MKAKYDVTRFNQTNGLPHTHVTKITQDDQGLIWIGTWNGLIRYDGYHFVSFKSRPGDGNNIISDRVRDVLPDREVFKDKKKIKGNLFVVLEDDVFLFDIHKYTFSEVDKPTADAVQKVRAHQAQVYTTPHNKTFGEVVIPDILHEFYDRQGILWLRTEDGIVKVSKQVVPWQRISDVSDNTVRMMYADNSKRIWIATKNDQHVGLYSSSLQFIGYLGTDGRLHREPVAFSNIYSMLHDSNGTVWLGSKPDGLFRLREKNGTFGIEHLSLGNDQNTNSVYDIKQDRKGRLWIATLGGGLIMISNPQAPLAQLKIYDAQHGMKGQPASTMKARKVQILDNGTLLLSTTNGLVTASNIYDFPSKPLTWHHHNREANRAESLSSSATMSTTQTIGGQILISTETGGVNILKNAADINNEVLNFTHFNERNGLANDATLALSQLSKDEVIVQQTNALSIINTADGTCRNFTMGFWGEALRFSDAAPIVTAGGNLLISLENGAIAIPLRMLQAPKTKPQIALTMFDCIGTDPDYAVNTRDTFRLSSDQRDFVLSFAALDYNGNNNIMYRTRMDDSDEWSVPSRNTDININNLSAGEHHLYICSTNAYGQWTDNTRMVTIIVEPTFFEAWYGILTLFLIISAVIAGITYTILYIRNMDARRRETLDAYLQLLEERSKVEIQTANAPEELPQAQQPALAAQETIIAPRLSADDENFLRKLTEFVEQNMSNSDITIGDIAQATATSRSGLNRRMHQLVGVTPADFLKEARLKHASQLLRQTGMTISEIAYACGFSDPKYFGKVFKASTGKAPKEYRNDSIKQ